MGIKINIQLGNCKEKIKVKYFDKEIEKLEKISKGDWIDLRSAETVQLNVGDP